MEIKKTLNEYVAPSMVRIIDDAEFCTAVIEGAISNDDEDHDLLIELMRAITDAARYASEVLGHMELVYANREKTPEMDRMIRERLGPGAGVSEFLRELFRLGIALPGNEVRRSDAP